MPGKAPRFPIFRRARARRHLLNDRDATCVHFPRSRHLKLFILYPEHDGNTTGPTPLGGRVSATRPWRTNGLTRARKVGRKCGRRGSSSPSLPAAATSSKTSRDAFSLPPLSPTPSLTPWNSPPTACQNRSAQLLSRVPTTAPVVTSPSLPSPASLEPAAIATDPGHRLGRGVGRCRQILRSP